jgi:hypothetical protein
MAREKLSSRPAAFIPMKMKATVDQASGVTITAVHPSVASPPGGREVTAGAVI